MQENKKTITDHNYYLGQEKIPGEGLVLEVTGVIPCENRGKEKQMGKDTNTFCSRECGRELMRNRVWFSIMSDQAQTI